MLLSVSHETSLHNRRAQDDVDELLKFSAPRAEEKEEESCLFQPVTGLSFCGNFLLPDQKGQELRPGFPLNANTKYELYVKNEDFASIHAGIKGSYDSAHDPTNTFFFDVNGLKTGKKLSFGAIMKSSGSKAYFHSQFQQIRAELDLNFNQDQATVEMIYNKLNKEHYGRVGIERISEKGAVMLFKPILEVKWPELPGKRACSTPNGVVAV